MSNSRNGSRKNVCSMSGQLKEAQHKLVMTQATVKAEREMKKSYREALLMSQSTTAATLPECTVASSTQANNVPASQTATAGPSGPALHSLVSLRAALTQALLALEGN